MYLSGCLSTALPPSCGVIVTPDMGNVLPAVRPWAADTGCYANPAKYSDERYLTYLADRAAHRERCLFATAPDVWSDAAATAEKARPVLREIRQLGLPAALVAQPGMTAGQVPWDEIDALFIGGPNEWQFSRGAWELAAIARGRGKHVHRGRVNSYRRLREAQLQGCHSADGTFLKFGPEVNAARIVGWLDRLAAQPLLMREMP